MPEPSTSLSLDASPAIPALTYRIEPAPGMRIRTDGAMRPDPGWAVVDEHGHAHRWDMTAPARPQPMPASLTSTQEHRDCNGVCSDDVCEGYTVTVWRCRQCSDVVEPGWVPDHHARRFGEWIETGPASAIVSVDAHLLPSPGPTYTATLRHPDGTETCGQAWIVERHFGIDGAHVTLQAPLPERRSPAGSPA